MQQLTTWQQQHTASSSLDFSHLVIGYYMAFEGDGWVLVTGVTKSCKGKYKSFLQGEQGNSLTTEPHQCATTENEDITRILRPRFDSEFATCMQMNAASIILRKRLAKNVSDVSSGSVAANVFEYFTSLQRYKEEVMSRDKLTRPELWLKLLSVVTTL